MAAETLRRFGAAAVSIREARLTVSPHTSNANFLMPTKPATTGPTYGGRREPSQCQRAQLAQPHVGRRMLESPASVS